MNPDLTWHLQVLDKKRGHYIALVERKVLPPGVCWLLKPSKSVSKKHPNIVSILELANMTTQECKLFWKPFIRKYGDKVQEHFGAEAFVRQFGGAPGAFAQKTGKQEMKVSMHVMASNPFREFTKKEFEEQDNDDDDDEEEHPETMTVRVKQLSPRQSIMEVEKQCAKLRLQKLEMMKPDIVAYNESPPFQILLQI
jgi:hypothetical protein